RPGRKDRRVLLRRSLGTRPPQRDPAHPGRTRLRLQRPHPGGVNSMAKKTTFAAASTHANPPNGTDVTVDDFVAYLPKHLYIFTVCREIWVDAGVNACLPRMQVFTASGKPKRDKNGNLVYEPATKWLDKNRGIEQATWWPGQPMLIEDRVVV